MTQQEPYRYQAYPSMRYHRDGRQTTVVLDPDQDAALGPDWHKEPVPTAVTPEAPDPSQELAALLESFQDLEESFQELQTRYQELETKYAEALILVDEATGRQAHGNSPAGSKRR